MAVVQTGRRFVTGAALGQCPDIGRGTDRGGGAPRARQGGHAEHDSDEARRIGMKSRPPWRWTHQAGRCDGPTDGRRAASDGGAVGP
jgi:hypothetical protein